MSAPSAAARPMDGPEGGAPLEEPLRWVLTRVRLRARRRAAWLRHLWAGEPRSLPNVVAHAEVDQLLEDRDAPEAEAAWWTAHGPRDLVEALRQVEAALAADEHSRLGRMSRLFGLEARERDLLHACLALAVDPALARVYAYLQDHSGRGYVTEELVARLFAHGRCSALGVEAAVRRWELVVEREVAPGEPRLWECEPGLRAWLLGEDALDAALVGVARRVEPREPLLGWPVEEATSLVHRLVEAGQPARVRLRVEGPPGSGRRTLAATVASRLGLALLAIDTDAVEEAAWPHVFLRAQRKAWLERCALAWVGEAASRRPWPRSLPWFPVQFVIGEGSPPIPAGEDVVDRRIEVPLPAVEERRALWRRLLPECAGWTDGGLERLATGHRTPVGRIAAVARHRVTGPEEAEALVREASRAQLGDLAQRLECPFTWEDLLLPEVLREGLRDLVFEARERAAFWEEHAARRLFPQGRGLLALFSGPPGTGKTMAAQVVAASLGVDLFRIDLSTVVSKYVGETSRNLQRILSRAADLDLVLLFDEADALFGQRTEIRDAHDRFANTDTSHLLQAIESYRGVALLASNRRGDIDRAFTRRLRYMLEFPAPDVAQRTTLWRRMVGELAGPQRLAALEAELPSLAEALELSGAQIKLGVLSALFAARREGTQVELRHLLRGVERELLKEGRALSSRTRERWVGRGG
ncbi:ATP-binding protein [Myxococcus sp. RHSTA-1-4]|uniref:AAA family ATPase n=1 Tax=Myxococcus sp. RHSTA-1-4 TaxID=2874601 RepID=UPI001CBA6F87|nr:ATP-binding protein [Myxococcus sp. RHSTA-1-4]MBZ4420168.1 ATP-binding protein [Myxococcus sp. RHSTA-1-4]